MSYDHNEDVNTPKTTTQPVKLRHFISGRLLTLNKVYEDQAYLTATLGRENSKEILDLPSYEDDQDEYFSSSRITKLNFELVIVEEKFLRDNSLVYLKSKSNIR